MGPFFNHEIIGVATYSSTTGPQSVTETPAFQKDRRFDGLGGPPTTQLVTGSRLCGFTPRAPPSLSAKALRDAMAAKLMSDSSFRNTSATP